MSTPSTLSRSPRLPLVLLAAASLLSGGAHCSSCVDGPFAWFLSPLPGLLSQASDDNPVVATLQLPFGPAPSELVFEVDGQPAADLASGDVTIEGFFVRTATVDLGALPEGERLITARGVVAGEPFSAETRLERIAIDRPEACEILNGVECILPFPSSRYLAPADTVTGFEVVLPDGILPAFPGPLDSAAYGGQDGFSPGVQVLMHFEGGVDPVASGASRLLPDTRSHDTTSIEPGSPTLLLDASDGWRPVLHWVEPDARAAGGPNPDRELLFLRPAETLKPGHRYVVALRNLVRPDGTAVEAEPIFAALRDGRPLDVPGFEERRRDLRHLLRELRLRAGVHRHDLVLAFDFVVQSDEDLTREMLAMRDRAFEWLADRTDPTFSVFPYADPGVEVGPDDDLSIENDCDDPEVSLWRRLRGTFQVPLFLSSDPLLAPIVGGRLVPDAFGLPEVQGVMDAPFSIDIPCAALDGPLPPLLGGHGLFGNARQIVGVADGLDARVTAAGDPGLLRVAGATDWLGLSSNDFAFTSLFNNFIVNGVLLDADNFGALPDRLRQGMTNALVLARMMSEGRFNADPSFQTPEGDGVIDPDAELQYAGISLGGIMGTFFAATSPDVGRLALDVPAANFSIMIQRSTAIGLIDLVLSFLNTDPMSQALFFGLAGESWDSAEPVGYLRHVTRAPLPGSGAPKNLLYTVAEFDGVVPNEASEIAIRTLGLPNLYDAAEPSGSSIAGRVGIPDRAPEDLPDEDDFVGGAVWYDLGMYDLSDPDHAGFVPPLANTSAGSPCDPHGTSFSTTAESRQIVRWLNDGVIENFCDGVCDSFATGGGFAPDELPAWLVEPCDPETATSPFPF